MKDHIMIELTPKPREQSWIFSHLIKWIHGIEAVGHNVWGDIVQVNAEDACAHGGVLKWAITLPDDSILKFGHPQWYAFCDDRIFLRDCKITIAHVDDHVEQYEMVDAHIYRVTRDA